MIAFTIYFINLKIKVYIFIIINFYFLKIKIYKKKYKIIRYDLVIKIFYNI